MCQIHQHKNYPPSAYLLLIQLMKLHSDLKGSVKNSLVSCLAVFKVLVTECILLSKRKDDTL